MASSTLLAVLVGASLLAGAAHAQTAPAASPPAASPPASNPAARPLSQCFRSHDYENFRPVNDHAFNIRVNVNTYFHIETQGTCPSLTSPGAVLITTIRGSDDICGPLDWDLKIGESGPGGFAVPCIVKSQTRLTPAEVAAIPPRQKP